MMNPRVKKKWVRALRSGEYEQANGSLVDGEVGGDVGYCCLGVLLAEARPESIGCQRVNYSGNGFNDYLMVKPNEQEEDVALIADDLVVLFGVDRNHQNKLAELNDRGDPFPVIADWIDANL